MNIGDILKTKIVDDNHLGNGIAKIGDITVFVPRTIIGDYVEIEIVDIDKNIAFGKLLSFLEKSNNHIDVTCPYYEECGGCDLLHISYAREKELKEKYTKKLFKCFDKKIVSLNRTNYRNKVTFHVKDGKIGFYKSKTNQLIEIEKCLLLENEINELLSVLNKIDLSNISEVVIKKASSDLLIDIKGEISKSDLKELISFNHIISVYQNNKLLYGNEYIKLKLGNIIYNINNNSFFQVNTLCAKELYDSLKTNVQNCNSLLDLYCGTGSIGIYLHQNASCITGIEINKDSVKCAEENINDNGINNYKIINSDASTIEKDYDIVIVDPPRSGLSKKVVKILNDMNTEKIIYISCNQSTLKRDVNLLSNYRVSDVSIFNMFPATKHVETVMILERNDNNE